MIHAFNRRGLDALDPQWAGGRPRLINDEDDIAFIVATAKDRPATHGLPFTHCSVRKLAAHLAHCDHRCPHPGRGHRITIGRERLRQLLREHGLSFQRTRTWKESTDPDKETKLDRIEVVTQRYPDRCLAFDQFGPVSIRPCHGVCWASETNRSGCPRPITAPTRWVRISPASSSIAHPTTDERERPDPPTYFLPTPGASRNCGTVTEYDGEPRQLSSEAPGLHTV